MNPHHERIKTEDIDQLKKEMRSLDLKTELTKSLAFQPIEPARDIVTKSYSLAPDMAGGWKPRNIEKKTSKSPFLLQYQDPLTDSLVEQFSKKNQTQQKIVYLGPRKSCSFALHENQSYSNPYSHKNKAISPIFKKNKSRQNIRVHNCFLAFDSEFECGNLDLAIQKAQNEFDLFMRVDTNTRGHSNWYFFSVQNREFTGRVRFNICNFRRQESLYQKGLKPFVKSLNQGTNWSQEGTNICYQRYKCTSLEEGTNQLSKYFMLTFDYEFKSPNDTVQFAYGVPYLYSQLLAFLDTLKNIDRLQPLKSLCGLDIPVLRITNQQTLEQSKKVLMITARVHPGESNSSYVIQGFLRCLCSDTTLSKLLKNSYIIYVVPMLNPDGVVAGNYRTSLFGKDLNRTYDLSRKYAFPQTFQLLQLAKKLKDKYKEQFSIFIDLHGHSTKKNVFMYGPDYSIQTANYNNCRQLPKIMSHVTNFFRYFSCSFRISGVKSSTARAIFNRTLNIPFSYTMECSNGIFINSSNQNISVNSAQWKQIGACLCQALQQFQGDRFSRIRRIKTQKTQVKTLYLNQIKPELRQEDLEGDSDIDSSQEDFPEEILLQLQRFISEGKSKRIPINQLKIATKTAIEEIPLKKVSKSTNKQSKKIIKRETTQEKRPENQKRQIQLPQILRHRGQIPMIRSRKKEQIANINNSSKRYAILPLEQVSFVERQSKSIVFIQDSTQKKQQQRPNNIERRNKRDKVLHSLIERLKTLK